MRSKKLLCPSLLAIPTLLLAAALTPGVFAQSWVDGHSGSPIPARAIAGGTENGHPLYVCRALYKGGLHPGKIVAGNCNIGFGGDEIVNPEYQFLVLDINPHAFPRWSPRGNLAEAFVGGSESSGQALRVCRAEYNGGVHPGKIVGSDCNIPYGHREIHVPQFEALYFREPWVSINSGDPLPKGAVVGGDENGNPLYVCRASYNGGLHPGKVVGSNCNIGYGGKEVILREYQVLVRSDDHSIAWGAPREGYADAFAGGTESGKPLLVCRAEYNGGIHPGKVISGECNISYGGQEVRVARFEVLYWK